MTDSSQSAHPVNPNDVTKPIRVLHIVSMLYSGGVERWVLDLFTAGRAKRLDMDIATVLPTEGLFGRRASELGIRVFQCPGQGNPIRFMQNLRSLLRREGPYDAVHCHLHAFSGFAMFAAWLNGVPARVTHSHNVVDNSSKSWKRKVYVEFSRILIKAFATSGMGPSSESTADLFGASWQKDPRWRVMRCGINLDPFLAPIPSDIHKELFGLPEDAIVMGSVGRLSPEKNSEMLVDILAAAVKLDSRAHLLIIGEGPLRERLWQKAKDANCESHLRLPGTRADVPAIMRGVMNVFLFPSPPPPLGNEALPIAVVEAQAAGLPVVISDGVTTEAIADPELVQRIPANAGAQAWAETALARYAQHEPSSSGETLRRLLASEFNSEVNIRKLARLYGRTEQ